MSTFRWQRKTGASLVELLCVMAIISILVALSMGPILKAFMHAKKVLGK
jgi:prepilin-type N-terminal cleavage/methylation domain-containing protein